LLLLVFVTEQRTDFRGALFTKSPVPPPATGICISRGYEALPNERGSFTVDACERLASFEGLSVTLAVDAQKASFLRVRRTAVTDTYEVSLHFPAPGVVHIALVGAPRDIAAGSPLLEVETQLAGNVSNTAGSRIELRTLDPQVLVEGSRLIETGHNGLITIIGTQNALLPPFSTFIQDVEPGVVELVQHRPLIVRGRALPSSPTVLLGTRPLPVISASSTEILAQIPSDFAQGTYPLSVESVLADEKVVVSVSPGVTGSVDVLEDLLVISPNPVLYNAQQTNANIVLWIPVFNPLGSDDAMIGSVDLSQLGGDPNVIFSGIGTPAVGPGGVTINWFRIPLQQGFRLPQTLQTNVDYPITIRVENRSFTRDEAVVLVRLRSQLGNGSAPAITRIETVPAATVPGDRVTFFVDVSDPEGISTLQIVSLRLTPLRGGVQSLQPVLTVPQGNAPLTSMVFSTNYTIPESLPPGTFQLQLTARDEDGNETVVNVPFVVHPPGGLALGSPPVFVGQPEARPQTVRPGEEITLFATAQDPDGTNTIEFVEVDLRRIGGGSAVRMTPATESPNIGTLPVTFEVEFTLPSDAFSGDFDLPVRVVDVNGLAAQTTIPLTVDASSGGGSGGSAPIFTGRLEAVPAIAAIGGKVSFFVGVRDPDGTSTIRQVVLDAIDLGLSVIEMDTVVSPVTGSTQPSIYSADITLPQNVLPGVYSLEVRATDEDGNLSRTTVPLTVSVLGESGGSPVLIRATATPSTVPADNTAEIFFTVEAEDTDGARDIDVVSLNLAPINLETEFLKLESGSIAEDGTRGIFTSRKIKIPTSVRNAGYDLTIELQDRSGHRTRGNVRITVGKTLGGSPPSFRESRFVPEIVRPGEDTRLFIEVQDPNGTDTVTVIADLTDIRSEVEELDELINFPQGTVTTKNTFATSDIEVPDDLTPGVYDIPITVIDDTGNEVMGAARLRVEKGGAEDGHPPAIDANRTFQTPRVFENDGSPDGELHVFVADAEDDVVTLIANIGAIGTARSASGRENRGDIDLLCNESHALACMEAGPPEGTSGRWFILDGIDVPATTLPSADPYLIEVTAIDAQGHTDKAEIPVRIGGPESEESLKVPPRFVTLVSVDEDEMELLLSAPIAVSSLERAGGQFLIQSTLNAAQTARVRRVSFDASARLLYLQTDSLMPGTPYTFRIAPPTTGIIPLTDIHGNRFSRDTGATIAFIGYQGKSDPPRIESVTVVEQGILDIRFRSPVLPSSVHPDLLPARADLRSMTSGESIAIGKGSLSRDARTLRLVVGSMREGDRYRLRIAGVLGPGLSEVPVTGAEMTFIMALPSEEDARCPLKLPTADLNGDGVVGDFEDFTLFSAVYNTTYDLQRADSCELPEETDSGRSGSSRPAASSDRTTPRGPRENVFGGEMPDFQY
jgi:hypothetical protein